MGFSDRPPRKAHGPTEARAAPTATGSASAGVRSARIDTCAAEFEAQTPYMYSTYEAEHGGYAECEARPTGARKVVILGGGPNRIGQGIEFDYCCCHACLRADQGRLRTIMVNCNPETVSTDYDTSDRLYFEPLTLEDVLEKSCASSRRTASCRASSSSSAARRR